jgi:cytochrome-b5 reductase
MFNAAKFARFSARSVVALSSLSLAQAASCDSTSVAPASALSPKEFRSFKVSAVEALTRDTKRFVFSLPNESDDLNLSPTGYIVAKAKIEGEDVVRPYTPTATDRGSFELVVKSYDNGKVSKAFGGLKVGDSFEFKGPFAKFDYHANSHAALGMVAGGTGITPMYRMIKTILDNPRDRTEVRLVYASRTPDDIILKTELDALALVYPNFKVLYTVDKASPEHNWNGQVGQISKEMLTSFLPPPNADGGAKVLVCGPPGMVKFLAGEKTKNYEQGELTGLLKELKYEKDAVFKY